MKVSRILYLIAIIFSSFPLQAQEEEDIPFVLIEKHPYYLQIDTITGETKEIPFKYFLDQWVIKNFQYPEEALKKKIQGRVILTLKIDKKGILSIEKAEGDPILEKAAREVFEGFPQLAPAEQRGKPVVTFYQYPISFRKD
ncbi:MULTISPECIES: energy transducer TonB [Capnocytophaga]|jgi:tonB family C-terminal domain|uniref:energy transducer TonB n=1 Tax=Capnocytophaga TaxID=1016 RepID=UPI00027C5C17|nr:MULTISPECIES: energy transducer TonB [Capnocytophaga]EJU30503.1 TonB-dependent receptor [Capnocytophaga sp. CM59]